MRGRELVEATAAPSQFKNQDQIQDDSKSDDSNVEQKLVNSNVDHELIEHQTLKARPTVVVEEFLYQEEDRENSSDSEE